MSIDLIYLYYLWQKISFQFVHKITIWVLLVFLTTAGAAWQLANVLDKHNAREREANMARKTALAYTIIAIISWLFSFIMS